MKESSFILQILTIYDGAITNSDGVLISGNPFM
jgi:hypothetical protein